MPSKLQKRIDLPNCQKHAQQNITATQPTFCVPPAHQAPLLLGPSVYVPSGCNHRLHNCITSPFQAQRSYGLRPRVHLGRSAHNPPFQKRLFGLRTPRNAWPLATESIYSYFRVPGPLHPALIQSGAHMYTIIYDPHVSVRSLIESKVAKDRTDDQTHVGTSWTWEQSCIERTE